MFDWHHLKDRGTNYCGHFFFAVGIAIRILLTGATLLIHAVIPYIQLPRYFMISVLSDYLFEKDYQIRKRMTDPGKARR